MFEKTVQSPYQSQGNFAKTLRVYVYGKDTVHLRVDSPLYRAAHMGDGAAITPEAALALAKALTEAAYVAKPSLTPKTLAVQATYEYSTGFQAGVDHQKAVGQSPFASLKPATEVPVSLIVETAKGLYKFVRSN